MAKQSPRPSWEIETQIDRTIIRLYGSKLEFDRVICVPHSMGKTLRGSVIDLGISPFSSLEFGGLSSVPISGVIHNGLGKTIRVMIEEVDAV